MIPDAARLNGCVTATSRAGCQRFGRKQPRTSCDEKESHDDRSHTPGPPLAEADRAPALPEAVANDEGSRVQADVGDPGGPRAGARVQPSAHRRRGVNIRGE